jgi:hypothetical protein
MCCDLLAAFCLQDIMFFGCGTENECPKWEDYTLVLVSNQQL